MYTETQPFAQGSVKTFLSGASRLALQAALLYICLFGGGFWLARKAPKKSLAQMLA
jgi:hypothetical protein